MRRLPPGPGGRLFDRPVNSRLGIAAGPLLNSRWIEGYARLGFDVLTYATVRSTFVPAFSLPNIRAVENREQAAVATKRPHNGDLTLAVSLGLPSMEPDVWRKDVRRARERIGAGQLLVVSVVGTHAAGADRDAFIEDYARCAAWAEEAGADVVEVHLAVLDPFSEHTQFVYENIPLSAQILYGVRTRVGRPVVAKLGVFRTPRLLHETATKLAPWVSGFVMTHGILRRVVDETGSPAFDGDGRDRAQVVGSDTFPVAFRQVSELLSWRRAGAWDRAVLAGGGVTTVDRVEQFLREGSDAVLVATAALFDPLFATRFRQARVAA